MNTARHPVPAAGIRTGAILLTIAALSATAAWVQAAAEPAASPPQPEARAVAFVHWGFENASPLQWNIDADGTVHAHLLYDYERESPNRAAGHWHFQLHGRPGSDVTLVLHNFDNIYNGRMGVPVSAKTICYHSADGRQWTAVPAEFLEGNRLRVRVHLDGDTLYLARLEPYRLSDLDRLLNEIRTHPLVAITEIGRTVEGRPLEMVRVGDPAAPCRVLLRARSHAWEPGGNWVVEGLVRALLDEDAVAAKCRPRFCVYVMPLANKDGVARGLTRFNVLGKDLNRDWDKPADPRLAPENSALESWVQRMVADGQPPHLAIDLHNDESGLLHVSSPTGPHRDRYLAQMQRLDQLLRKHTWFTEGSTKPRAGGAATVGEGLTQRYRIDACILELNANWVAGLKQPPSAVAWKQFGRQLREVFCEYFP